MRQLYSFIFIFLSILLLPLNAIAVEQHQQDDAIEVTVNINTATAGEIALMLQGIGEKKAQDIVDFRNEHGKFQNIESLKQVKGIGQSTIDKNKDRILL
ncbi:ComEA family DNA-binding protein [Vibrio rumoiensis]|uniref:ComEA family DNA-binding protein n=1 Tax=Vibrio rumoiensis TaxID=76258 RepID=A0ABW7IWJ1_9VIBR|nr:helix-hairpin-helix domain-containing protein [Vibrio rumoiensis]